MNQNSLSLYQFLPIEIVRAKNFYLFDSNGKKYLNFSGSSALVSPDHSNKVIIDALKDEAEELWDCPELFLFKTQQKYGKKLLKLSFADSAFFYNSDIEAFEMAVQMILQYQLDKNNPNLQTKKNKIITFSGSYCANDPSRNNFITLIPNDIQQLNGAINDEIAGILLEPIQIEDGIHGFDHDFIRHIRKVCTENDIILCFDETVTGFGRTGSLFYYQQVGIIPDIMILSKIMADGLPISACLTNSDIANATTKSIRKHVFGGNSLAMAVASSVINEVLKPGLFDKVLGSGKYLAERIAILKEKYPKIIKSVRSYGLVIGIEVENSAQVLINKIIGYGLIVTNTQKDKVIKLLPPLHIQKTHIEEAYNILDQVFANEMNRDKGSNKDYISGKYRI